MTVEEVRGEQVAAVLAYMAESNGDVAAVEPAPAPGVVFVRISRNHPRHVAALRAIVAGGVELRFQHSPAADAEPASES